MSTMIQNMTGGYKSSAKIVAGTLVLSLPDALSPVVWRMDLGTAKSSAIEVRENETGQYDLILKTPKADTHIIAVYTFKIKATRALMVITKAMGKADRQIVPKGEERQRYLPVPVQTPKLRMSFARGFWIFIKCFLALFSIILILIGGFVVGKLVISMNTQLSNNAAMMSRGTDYSPVTQAPAPIQKRVGEVMSADEFLRKK